MEPNETSAGAPSEQNDATMQNDSNMTAETPSVDVAVGAEAIVASEEIAESAKMPKDDVGGGMMTSGAEPKKNGKGMLIGMILFALLAVGGIGFGVWAMMDGNSQTKTLNSQIADLKKTNSELMEKMAEANENANTNDGGDMVINIDTNSDVDSEDYIYVGEWGIKIKIPENLDKVSYAFKQHSDVTGGEAGLVVSGVRGYDGRLPGFANISENVDGLGYVDRVLAGQGCGSGYTKVFSDNGFDYCYSHPQALFSVEDELMGLEAESTALVTSMLSNAENYSTI